MTLWGRTNREVMYLSSTSSISLQTDEGRPSGCWRGWDRPWPGSPTQALKRTSQNRCRHVALRLSPQVVEEPEEDGYNSSPPAPLYPIARTAPPACIRHQQAVAGSASAHDPALSAEALVTWQSLSSSLTSLPLPFSLDTFPPVGAAVYFLSRAENLACPLCSHLGLCSYRFWMLLGRL